MYTIFVGDKPIILTTKLEKETDFKTYLLKTVNIGKVIKTLANTDLMGVHLVHNKENKLLKKFLGLLPNVIAGGGNSFLFISFRQWLSKSIKNRDLKTSIRRFTDNSTTVDQHYHPFSFFSIAKDCEHLLLLIDGFEGKNLN